MFIYFREKFSPTRLLGTTCLFIFGANSQLQDYSLVKIHEKEKESSFRSGGILATIKYITIFTV